MGRKKVTECLGCGSTEIHREARCKPCIREREEAIKAQRVASGEIHSEMVCSKCGTLRRKYYDNGGQTHCQVCAKAWAEANKEHVRERDRRRGKAWRDKNRDKIRAADQKWRDENREMLQIREKYSRAKRYGLSAEEYDAMIERQRNLCAICGLPESAIDPRLGTIKSLAIDHDHETGRVRGLLCSLCNTALGCVKDDIGTLNKAIAYLQHYVP